MASNTEGQHAGEFVVSEANGHRSREEVTLTGVNGEAGLVLGIVTASGKYTEFDDDASDGTETAAGILYDDVDASSADQAATVIVRDAEVNVDELKWKSDQDATDIANGKTELQALGIRLR